MSEMVQAQEEQSWTEARQRVTVLHRQRRLGIRVRVTSSAPALMTFSDID